MSSGDAPPTQTHGTGGQRPARLSWDWSAILSVIAGAAVGVGFIRADPLAGLYSAAAIAAVAGAAATHRSRWYVTSAFTTFIVFLLMLYSNPHDARSRFDERVLETLLGVALAYAFGLGIPFLLQRHQRQS